MAQEIFLNSLKQFSALVMFDSRDTHKQDVHSAMWEIERLGTTNAVAILATFYVKCRCASNDRQQRYA